MKSAGNLEKAINSGRFVVTAECGPPRGADPAVMKRKASFLRGFVDAANVTDNQTSVVRMSSMAACILLLQEGVEPVLQMTSRDRNRIALQSDLLGAASLGISNVLCLSGDHPKFGDHPEAKGVFDIDSIQMIQAFKGMRDEGRLISGRELTVSPKVLIGAVENPFSTPLEFRVPRLAKKIAAGADFIQTQSVFNLERFSAWMSDVRERGLHEKTAILAGITPFKSAKMAEYMAHKVPGMDVPQNLIDRIKGVKPESVREEGIKICLEIIEQVRRIPGVRGIHIMAIEWEEMVSEIVKRASLRS